VKSVTHDYGVLQSVTNGRNPKCGKLIVDETNTIITRVNEIKIAYKILGTGEPLILIMGFGGSMNNWDTTLIRALSSRNTTIIFDNRGVGLTTTGTKEFSMDQFANDTVCLLDALNIKKTNVLGFSMGGMIAQELALTYPDKVNKLILYASYCGGNDSIYPSSPEFFDTFSANSGVTSNVLLRSASLMFPKKWCAENPDYHHLFDNPSSIISRDTIINQGKAIFYWRGTGDRLNQIAKPTLIITGTEDILVPSINSSIIAERISNSQLIQIKGSGHGLMYQVPEKFCNIVSQFLEY